jgi:hypothetical protein
MTQSRRPRRRRGDPVFDLAERLVAVAFEPLEGKPANPEALREIAGAAIQMALFCVELQVHATGWFDDAEVADFIRSIAVAELQRLRDNSDRRRRRRKRF